MYIKNALVLTEKFKLEKVPFKTENGVFADFCAAEDALDLSGKLIIPGLIDIHTHGAVGTDTMDSDFNFDKWQGFLLKSGVTTFFPTTVSATKQHILSALSALAANEKVEGINLEGPYLNPEKRGAHDITTIRDVDIDEFECFYKASGKKIKITTVAPEMGSNAAAIKKITENFDVKVSLGHSTADFDTAMKGFDAGATHITHTFNAMPSLLHRAPGLAGAAFMRGNVFCEVLSDGIHLHPSIVNMLYKILGSDRMVLISDSMAATGLCDGSYMLGSMHVTVKDSVARTDDGAISGSTKNLMQMVRKAISFGIPFEDAVKCASLTPARAVGISDTHGSIALGKKADFSVCDSELNVYAVFKNGKLVYGEI